MKIFISWSGERSKMIAKALKQWIPYVIQKAKPWVSEEDISSGARWNEEIRKELAKTNFGIICLTAENLTAPWINFEAGAIAKTLLEDSFVCPYGLSSKDILPGPLTQFQSRENTKEDTFKLIETINELTEESLPSEQLNQTFERWWPDLEKKLKESSEIPVVEISKRTSEAMIEEILELVRSLTRKMSTVSDENKLYQLYTRAYRHSSEIDAQKEDEINNAILDRLFPSSAKEEDVWWRASKKNKNSED